MYDFYVIITYLERKNNERVNGVNKYQFKERRYYEKAKNGYMHRIIQNDDWEKYYPEKADNVWYQFYFENENDKVILYQIINVFQ